LLFPKPVNKVQEQRQMPTLFTHCNWWG